MSYQSKTLKTLAVGERTFHYHSLPALEDARVAALPYSIRVLLESAVRNCDEFEVRGVDVERILSWQSTAGQVEVPFKPARVLLQDFTGVPAVVDLAAMRDAMVRLGAPAARINPLVPLDLVIDHSVQVDAFATAAALQQNQELELARNRERFVFLKWGARAFTGMRVIPPGSGIVHQVNLEYLGRCVFRNTDAAAAAGTAGLLYPDSVVGTDSHTPMINGLAVCGWGVGGIEAEAVMLGQPISMVLPEVVGLRLTGALPAHTTSTDLVLTIVQLLRRVGVVDKFVEFFGPGVQHLSIADRATLSNMAPEYGATVGFFPADHVTMTYLRQTGRPDDVVQYVEAYLRAQGLFCDYSSDAAAGGGAAVVRYTTVVDLDLASVQPCVAGPKRPQDRVALSGMQDDFRQCLAAKVGFKGFGLPADRLALRVPVPALGADVQLGHGAVVIAAITSCTNTSNPMVMLAAGLLARNAVAAGLRVPPYVKTSLSPGSGVVSRYLADAALQPALDALGFHVVGYGCMTCIGNSGELHPAVAEALAAPGAAADLVPAAVLSGNRNFEGRIHAAVKANYLASPPLVVAYALAGSVDFDFERTPLGRHRDTGADVFLRDVWPSADEVRDLAQRTVLPGMFKQVYDHIEAGTPQWNALAAPAGERYQWDAASTYIHNPPFFQTVQLEPPPVRNIDAAYCLLNLGDSITTDHISPAGNIARKSPAGRYLAERGVDYADWNTYGARRGNDEVMARGTFANIRLINKLVAATAGPRTLHLPSAAEMDVFDAAAAYQAAGSPVIVLAGQDYGSGSSRDWAAKGPSLLGVKAVIAQSFERIHRSNLVGMGIVPLCFLDGQSADSLGLTGRERFSIDLNGGHLTPGQRITVSLDDGRSFETTLRFDTPVELAYFCHGGILPFVLRRLLKQQ